MACKCVRSLYFARFLGVSMGFIADFVNGGFEGVRMVFEECSNSESSVFKCGAAYDE